MTKVERKARWMAAFETQCLAAGIDADTIHKVDPWLKSNRFWDTANHYFLQGMTVELAVRCFQEILIAN
jgi:hypothetical protein